MNYIDQVKEDVSEYIANEINLSDFGDREELESYLNDHLFANDSVTGNASGSYTFNRVKAREYVLDDIDTVKEALTEFGVEAEEIGKRFLDEDWEYLDVTARCYVLSSAISEVLDELNID